jgi:hypothetical protein
VTTARSRGEAAGSGGRWAALALAGVFLLIAGAFLAIVVFGPRGPGAVLVQVDPGLTVLEREGGFDLAGLVGDWRLQGRMTLDAGRRLELQLQLTDRTGRPAPDALAPRLHAAALEQRLPPVALPVVALGEGRFAAGYPVPTGGAWRFQVGAGDTALGFTLDLRD